MYTRGSRVSLLREENDRVFASRMKIFTVIERVNVAAAFRDDSSSFYRRKIFAGWKIFLGEKFLHKIR